MAGVNRTRITAELFVDTMLDLTAESGGSQDVNLRQICRRIGCAHTNAYNYFSSYEDLRWAAFRRAMRIYGEYLIHDLDDSLPPAEYLRRLITNLATFPLENQGLYRFIASDPIDIDAIPPDLLETIGDMKAWLFAVLEAVYSPRLAPTVAERISNIVIAYIDGETLNLINGRVLPGEDVRGRVVENSLRMIDLMGSHLADDPQPPMEDRIDRTYPALDLSEMKGSN